MTHAWGGAIAASRDWYSSVGMDKATGMAWAGAYVGDGVATTNLAGRTLRDLIRGEQSELTGLPWVNHRSKSWEPEPFRWLGVNASLKAMASADGYEARRAVRQDALRWSRRSSAPEPGARPPPQGTL